MPDYIHEPDARLLPPARELLHHTSVKRRLIGMRTLVGLALAAGPKFDALLRVAETVSCASRAEDDSDAARTRRLDALLDEVGKAVKGDT